MRQPLEQSRTQNLSEQSWAVDATWSHPEIWNSWIILLTGAQQFAQLDRVASALLATVPRHTRQLHCPVPAARRRHYRRSRRRRLRALDTCCCRRSVGDCSGCSAHWLVGQFAWSPGFDRTGTCFSHSLILSWRLVWRRRAAVDRREQLECARLARACGLCRSRRWRLGAGEALGDREPRRGRVALLGRARELVICHPYLRGTPALLSSLRVFIRSPLCKEYCSTFHYTTVQYSTDVMPCPLCVAFWRALLRSHAFMRSHTVMHLCLIAHSLFCVYFFECSFVLIQ